MATVLKDRLINPPEQLAERRCFIDAPQALEYRAQQPQLIGGKNPGAKDTLTTHTDLERHLIR
jgi:hypothetical protein